MLAGTSPSASHPNAVADFGILCVHGIGMQKEGETLRTIAGPLLEQFKDDGAEVAYGETILKPCQQLDAGPARISVTVTRGEKASSLLIAESRWADVFDAPSYGQLLGWLMSHGTWIAIRHAAFSVSAPVRFFERRYDRKRKPRPSWLGFADVMLAYLAALVSVFFVALPLQLFLLTVGALAILPFKWTQSLAQRVAFGASAILGDASVYSADPTLRNAILTRVRTDFAWMRKRTVESGPIIVLAHSQGAAVVYDLLSSMSDLARVRLVTYGEGIRKLTELELGARQRPFIIAVCGWLWLFGLVALVAVWFAGIYIMESLAAPGAAAIGDRVGSLLLFYLLAFFLLSTSIYHLARSREAKVDKPVAEGVAGLLKKGLEWVDLYASSDPVPRGPLLGGMELKQDVGGWQVFEKFPGLRGRRVANRLSTINDHTSYWDAPNDFVPFVARIITEWMGWPSLAVPLSLRMWRLWLRRVAGWILTALAIATFWRAGDPLRDVIWTPIWGMLPLTPDSLASHVVALYSLRDPAVTLAGLITFLLLAFCYCRFVLDPAWLGWERALRNLPDGVSSKHESFACRVGYWSGAALPWLRGALCFAVTAAPVGMLFGSIRRGNYGPTLGSLTAVADWGRTVIAASLLGVIYVSAFIAIVGAGVLVREWWQKRRQQKD